MKLGIENKTAFVTGASSGIGTAVARQLADEGARVAVGYHTRREAADEVVRSIEGAGGQALAVALDLTDPDTVRGAVAAVVDRWGTLDIAVSCGAPFPTPGPFVSLDDDGWNRALRDQLEGPGNLVRAVLPAMTRAGWGRIVLVSTVHAVMGSPGVVAHTAAKSGLHGLTRSLAKEVGPQGVLVNAVLPGLTTTPEALQRFPAERLASSAAQIPTGHATTPETVAALIAFLVSDANGNVTGELIKAAGGL